MTAEAGLRRTLEEAYERIRSALERKDFEAFRGLVHPAPASPDAWEETAADLAESFPPLSGTRFVAARACGDWAGYYFETGLDDPDYATLELIRFRRAGPGWALSGGPASSQYERSADPAAVRDALLFEIQNDPYLKLPGEPGGDEDESADFPSP